MRVGVIYLALLCLPNLRCDGLFFDLTSSGVVEETIEVTIHIRYKADPLINNSEKSRARQQDLSNLRCVRPERGSKNSRIVSIYDRAASSNDTARTHDRLGLVVLRDGLDLLGRKLDVHGIDQILEVLERGRADDGSGNSRGAV